MSVNIMGRPRQGDLDKAILRSAAAILERENYAAVSIAAVAAEAGTTRAAVYRRHASVAALVTAVFRERFGTDPGVDTGSLGTDLRAIQEHRMGLFNHPLVVRGLPGLLDELSLDPGTAQEFSATFLAPRRDATTRALARALARGEITEPVDAEWISDLLTGPLLMRATLPGLETINQDLVDRTVNAALRELLPRSTRVAPQVRRS